MGKGAPGVLLLLLLPLSLPLLLPLLLLLPATGGAVSDAPDAAAAGASLPLPMPSACCSTSSRLACAGNAFLTPNTLTAPGSPLHKLRKQLPGSCASQHAGHLRACMRCTLDGGLNLQGD